jgi:hypothetical protein
VAEILLNGRNFTQWPKFYPVAEILPSSKKLPSGEKLAQRHNFFEWQKVYPDFTQWQKFYPVVKNYPVAEILPSDINFTAARVSADKKVTEEKQKEILYCTLFRRLESTMCLYGTLSLLKF